MNRLATVEGIQKRIFFLRGHKVMLSMDLAELYDVEARALVQAVKRNRERFPDDFMFQLNKTEFANLKSQIVTSSWGGIRRAAPYAFTEQGVAMLSSVLKSRRAIQVTMSPHDPWRFVALHPLQRKSNVYPGVAWRDGRLEPQQ
jgi:hypothetical protein